MKNKPITIDSYHYYRRKENFYFESLKNIPGHTSGELSDITISNLLITNNNYYENYPNSIFSCEDYINLSIVNSTIADNNLLSNSTGRLFSFPSNLYTSRTNSLSIYNSIFWNNTTAYIDIDASNSLIISNSLFDENFVRDNNFPFDLEENYCQIADPLFTNRDGFPHGINNNSPAYRTGTIDIDNYNFPLYDIVGNPRIIESAIDIGAYQCPSPNNIDDKLILPTVFSVESFPNPFNPSITIKFTMNNADDCLLTVYNIKGEKIKTLANRYFKEGIHEVIWNGKDNDDKEVSSGIYFYFLKVGEYSSVKKITLLK
jgi:hypothetical protein